MNNQLHYVDVDGGIIKAEQDEVKKDRNEAHEFLTEFFKMIVNSTPGFSEMGDFKILNKSLIPNFMYGKCVLILWGKDFIEIYEIKPKGHHKPEQHYYEDSKQLDKYISALNYWGWYPEQPARRGTIFSTTSRGRSLLIPSVRHPNKYIKYSTFYSDGYINHRLRYGDEKGTYVTDNYKGMIYWEYIDKDEYDPKEHVIWKCNGKDKGGHYEEDSYSAEIKNEYVDEDDIAAAIGWTALGAAIWWLIKVGVSGYTGQWWILGCG